MDNVGDNVIGWINLLVGCYWLAVLSMSLFDCTNFLYEMILFRHHSPLGRDFSGAKISHFTHGQYVSIAID